MSAQPMVPVNTALDWIANTTPSSERRRRVVVQAVEAIPVADMREAFWCEPCGMLELDSAQVTVWCPRCDGERRPVLWAERPEP